MELLTPLTDLLEREGDFSEKEVRRLGIEIADALSYCAGKNVLHRDGKPQNIFVGKNGEYKLGDFGIARIMEKTGCATTRVGTESYMAPEIYYGGAYDARADLYSLGIVLYWLLNERKVPFVVSNTAGEKQDALARRFHGEALPQPAHGSEELIMAVMKAYAYDPQGRYSDAAGLKGIRHQRYFENEPKKRC